MIKRILLILLVSATITKAGAQEYDMAPPSFGPSKAAPAIDSSKKVYLGLGTGINNYVGIIGIGADFRVYKTFFFRVGAGIGTWGTKVSVGMRYEQSYGKGWCFGVAYTNSSGLTDFKTQLQTDSASTTVTKQVTLNLLSAGTLNFTASYNWIFHRHNKFYLEFGYAIPLQTDPYVVEDGSVLTGTSKVTLSLISPGGLEIDCGVMFGL